MQHGSVIEERIREFAARRISQGFRHEETLAEIMAFCSDVTAKRPLMDFPEIDWSVESFAWSLVDPENGSEGLLPLGDLICGLLLYCAKAFQAGISPTDGRSYGASLNALLDDVQHKRAQRFLRTAIVREFEAVVGKIQIAALEGRYLEAFNLSHTAIEMLMPYCEAWRKIGGVGGTPMRAVWDRIAGHYCRNAVALLDEQAITRLIEILTLIESSIPLRDRKPLLKLCKHVIAHIPVARSIYAVVMEKGEILQKDIWKILNVPGNHYFYIIDRAENLGIISRTRFRLRLRRGAPISLGEHSSP